MNRQALSSGEFKATVALALIAHTGRHTSHELLKMDSIFDMYDTPGGIARRWKNGDGCGLLIRSWLLFCVTKPLILLVTPV